MSGFTYAKKPIQIAEGPGVSLTDSEGIDYLDFGGSYACVPLGHGHDAVQSAVNDQFSTLTFVQAIYPVEIRQQLYETLVAAAPAAGKHVVRLPPPLVVEKEHATQVVSALSNVLS